MFVVNQFFSQKWSPKFSKVKFCSKTVSTMFAVFFFSTQENCGACVINGAIKCKLFVGKYLKTCRWVSYTFLQKPSLFNHFWIRASFSRIFLFVKSTILGKSIFGGFDGVEMWWRKNSFTNQVVKSKFLFPFFLSNLMVFKFKRFFWFFFSLRKNRAIKK